MASEGQTVENAETGERITFLSITPELLVMDDVWPRPGHRAIEHLHPEMEERWTVIEGRAAFRIGGEELELGPGEWIEAQAGAPHLAWNPTDGPVRLRIEMRPALRWAEFTERLFRGDPPEKLLREFSREIALPVG
jgi:mannose-6-phosphate isomerase-like protein (cupin superfamily)